MAAGHVPSVFDDFLGSAHVFSVAVEQIIQEKIWREASGGELSLAQLKVLKLVSVSSTHTLGDVAAFLGISNAAASKAVDRLVRRMLVQRGEAEGDRRAIQLSLTGAGRRLLEAYDGAMRKRLGEIFEHYTTDELRRAVEFLDKITAEIVNKAPLPEDICVQCGIYFRERCLVRQRLQRDCLYQRKKDFRARQQNPATPERSA